jgi:motility quorum-sensing regulator / GCU-specific mRNA interferase toxin
MIRDKGTPHYRLAAVLRTVATRGVDAFTRMALDNARLMGLSGAEALSVVASLRNGYFYKSMSTKSDYRVWQDVYHAPCPNGKVAYIKLTLQDGAVVIQFKEK